MKADILIKRGLKADLPQLKESEPGFATDTKEFFIGTKDGNAIVGGSKNDIPGNHTTDLKWTITDNQSDATKKILSITESVPDVFPNGNNNTIYISDRYFDAVQQKYNLRGDYNSFNQFPASKEFDLSKTRYAYIILTLNGDYVSEIYKIDLLLGVECTYKPINVHMLEDFYTFENAINVLQEKKEPIQRVFHIAISSSNTTGDTAPYTLTYNYTNAHGRTNAIVDFSAEDWSGQPMTVSDYDDFINAKIGVVSLANDILTLKLYGTKPSTLHLNVTMF